MGSGLIKFNMICKPGRKFCLLVTMVTVKLQDLHFKFEIIIKPACTRTIITAIGNLQNNKLVNLQ